MESLGVAASRIAGPSAESGTRIIRTVREMRNYREQLSIDASVGLVPTRGALHDGQLAMIHACRQNADVCIVTMFINPNQFNDFDYSTYPKSEEADIRHCRILKVDAVFIPGQEELFPKGPQQLVMKTDIGEKIISNAGDHGKSEAYRCPSYFHAVSTVILKLLYLVSPHQLYCGQKDAQQCSVVRALCRDLNHLCKVFVISTVRDADGLALSSRDGSLTPYQREYAPLVHQCLAVAQEVVNHGIWDVATILERMSVFLNWSISQLDQNQLDFEVEYMDICEWSTMDPVRGKIPLNVVSIVCIGVRMGKARLLDNIILDLSRVARGS